jgi:ornithine decarboxylase
MKCFPHPEIVNRLYCLGAGFDCASLPEIQAALRVGAAPSDIIFANPVKPRRSIQAAFELGVNTFTFDSEHELRLMEEVRAGRDAAFVLRFKPPSEEGSLCCFGVKFGADRDDTARLLRLAVTLGAPISGFSFHVGSGGATPAAFRAAVEYASEAWDVATSLGLKPKMLDIGGGFMTTGGQKHMPGARRSFGSLARALAPTLDAFRFQHPEAVLISEPGRFFAADTVTMAFRVYARRVCFEEHSDDPEAVRVERVRKGLETPSEVKLYVGDGVYGCANNVLLDHAHLDFGLLGAEGQPIATGPAFPTRVFGPTCDSLDCLSEDALPLLEIGDWLLLESFGAYTASAAVAFNGIAPAQLVVVDVKEGEIIEIEPRPQSSMTPLFGSPMRATPGTQD